jgi:ribosome maturation factor RimP
MWTETRVMQEHATDTNLAEATDLVAAELHAANKRPADKSSIDDKVRVVVMAVVQAAGLDLVELRVLRAPRNTFRVLLFIDRPLDEPGVTIDDCAAISRKVGAELEVDDPFPGNWNLDVSSPGMKRRLRGIEDFDAFMGIRARVKVRTDDGRKITWIGELAAVDAAGVTLMTDGAKPQVVAHEDIERAELDPTIEQWLDLGQRREESDAGEGSNDHEAAAGVVSTSEGVSG